MTPNPDDRDASQMAWIAAELDTVMEATTDHDVIGRALSAAAVRRYRSQWGVDKVIDGFQFGRFTYVFDSTPEGATDRTEPANRVLAAWGVSVPHQRFGDRRNLRRFPVPPLDRRFDRGHLIAMSMGGGDYVNLVPQDPRLNRGWSESGKRWRSLERAVTADPGALVFVGVHYSDLTDIPNSFGYAIVHTDQGTRVETFLNQPSETNICGVAMGQSEERSGVRLQSISEGGGTS